ncbi:MAG: hypothetical protein NW200_11780 [Hyphomonadaceae bacterium]|nr:hypothetical protein [Hyphomonadaceae bacterium]
MTDRTDLPPALLDQLIAALLAFFGVPVRFALRVLGDCVTVRRRFARLLTVCRRRRIPLRFEGEDEATVQARIALLDWFARDPRKARRHLARRRWGLRAYFWAQFGPIPRPVVRVMGDAPADACSATAPSPDTS